MSDYVSRLGRGINAALRVVRAGVETIHAFPVADVATITSDERKRVRSAAVAIVEAIDRVETMFSVTGDMMPARGETDRLRQRLEAQEGRSPVARLATGTESAPHDARPSP